jgi:hypothetical protein
MTNRPQAALLVIPSSIDGLLSESPGVDLQTENFTTAGGVDFSVVKVAGNVHGTVG